MTQRVELSTQVAEHAVWLSAFLRGLTRSEADAEDAFQDVWLRVLKAGGIPDGANVRAYLARTARSAVIDRYRRAWRMELVLDAPDDSGETRADSLVAETARPDESFQVSATHAEVLSAIRALPLGPRQTVLLRIEGELKFQEIAEELGVPLGTVLTWMRVATMRLRKLMEGRNG